MYSAPNVTSPPQMKACKHFLTQIAICYTSRAARESASCNAVSTITNGLMFVPLIEAVNKLCRYKCHTRAPNNCFNQANIVVVQISVNGSPIFIGELLFQKVFAENDLGEHCTRIYFSLRSAIATSDIPHHEMGP